mgnify:CR=1 FL=1
MIPTTSVIGFSSRNDVDRLCEEIRDDAVLAFRARGLESEVFVVSSGSWAWLRGPS